MKRSICVLLLICAFALTSIAPSCECSSGNPWTARTSLPTPVSGLEAAVAYGKIYAIGGSVNYEYDPISDAWVTKTSMPTLRGDGVAVASYQNKIYVVGGRVSGGATIGINEVYDPTTDTWETKAPMPPLGRA